MVEQRPLGSIVSHLVLIAGVAVVALPDGAWTNVLTGDGHASEVSFAKLCDGFPLAVLERDLSPVL